MSEKEIDEIIDRNLFRKQVYDSVPEGTSRILDFGCCEGELVLRLRRDKGCTEVYGIDVKEEYRDAIRHLDGGMTWVKADGDFHPIRTNPNTLHPRRAALRARRHDPPKP